MPLDQELQAARDRIYRYWNQDGLLDIYLGLGLLLVGWAVANARPVVIAPVAGGMLLFFHAAKRRITVPRIGSVRFFRCEAFPAVGMLVLCFATLLAALLFPRLAAPAWIAGHATFALGVATGGLMAALGWSLRVRRLASYGVLLAAVAAGVDLSGSRLPVVLATTGLTIAAVGVFLLIRFVRAYSVIPEEEPHVAP